MSTEPLKLKWHPRLKKIFKDSALWWERKIIRDNDYRKRAEELALALEKPDQVRVNVSSDILMPLARGIEAELAAQRGDIETLCDALRNGMSLRAIFFRWPASLNQHQTDYVMLPLTSGMEALGPTWLSDFKTGRICAELFIAMAEKAQRLKSPGAFHDGWGKGTIDAFLVALLSQAYDIPTTFHPAKPLIEPYQQLLEHWRSPDEATFRHVMQAAAEWHITHSLVGATNKRHDFTDSTDIVFPGELLAVQALRRRDGLPAFDTGHLLVDTPWSLIRDLPDCPPDPLYVALEARLKQDYPDFR